MQRRRFVSLACQTAIAGAWPAWALQASAQEGTTPGLTDQAIHIASSVPLTGTLVGFGQAVQKGAGAAFAEINAQGGIYGRQIRLHLVDDGYDPSARWPTSKTSFKSAKPWPCSRAWARPTTRPSPR